MRSCLVLSFGAAFVVVLLAFLVFCVRPTYPKGMAELCGTYVADHRLVRSKFTLRADGSFVQTITIKATSRVASSRGTWSYDPSDGYVTFEEGFLLALTLDKSEVDANYATPWPGVVARPAQYCLGFGRLVISESNGGQEWWKTDEAQPDATSTLNSHHSNQRPSPSGDGGP